MSAYNSNLCYRIRSMFVDFLGDKLTAEPLTRGERYIVFDMWCNLETCVTSWIDFRQGLSFCKQKSMTVNQAYVEDIAFLFWFYSQNHTLEECKAKFESLLKECFPYFDESRSDFCEDCDIIMAHRAKKLGVEYKHMFPQVVPQTKESEDEEN